MISKIFLYKSNSLNPYQNLAIEKILFDTCQEDWLIFYLWQNQNTIVIGRNQNPWAECQCDLIHNEGACIARRLSGGGAVFHDIGNLNYTFITSEKNYDLTKQFELIKKACSYAGIDTATSGRNDILADGKKFSGNAFYNHKNKVYHHGTILISTDINKMQRYLTPDAKKLQSKGIKSVKSRVINLSELNNELTTKKMEKYLIEALNDIYGLEYDEINISNHEEVNKLTEKYSSWDYIYGTTIPFNYSCNERFDWGNISLNLNIDKGKIEDIQIFTDSMNWELSQLLHDTIIGCKLEYNSILNSMSKQLPTQISEDVSALIINKFS